MRFEVSMRPEIFVPRGKATFPLTTTSLTSCIETALPGASTEEMLCNVRTTSVVPAGIVTAKEACIARQAMLAAASRMKVVIRL